MFISKRDIVIVQKDRIITRLSYLIELYKKIQLSLFVNNIADFVENDYNFDNLVVMNNYDAKCQNSFYELNYPRVWSMISKIVVANYRKRNRVKKRFINMLDNAVHPIYFGTLTFTNEVLENTSQKTRRVYVHRFLKSISDTYIANIDFGDLNNREHYHCIIECKKHSDLKLWQYGIANVKKVRNTDKDIKRISKYTVKLLNHCVKGSADYLVVSRKTKK